MERSDTLTRAGIKRKNMRPSLLAQISQQRASPLGKDIPPELQGRIDDEIALRGSMIQQAHDESDEEEERKNRLALENLIGLKRTPRNAPNAGGAGIFGG